MYNRVPFLSIEPQFNLGVSNAAFDDYGKDEHDATEMQGGSMAQNAL